MKNLIYYLGISILFLISLQNICAQEASEADQANNLAKTAQNPIASLISLPFQFNWNMGMGEYDRTQTIINIQPVLPVKIGENWNMINRIIMPVMKQPHFNFESGSTTGLGAINYTAFFTPAPIGKTALGFGPSFLIPSNSSSDLGDGQFAVGPSFVLFSAAGHWTFGFVAAQNWAYYSPNAAEKHSTFFTQYFINYNLKKAWSIGTAPTITVNWKAEEGEKAVVPFGLNVAKVTHFGKQPIRLTMGYYHNSIVPEAGAKGGQLQFMAVLLFPKK